MQLKAKITVKKGRLGHKRQKLKSTWKSGYGISKKVSIHNTQYTIYSTQDYSEIVRVIIGLVGCTLSLLN